MLFITFNLDTVNSDDKARYVQKTLQESEKNLADLRLSMQGYMRNQDRSPSFFVSSQFG